MSSPAFKETTLRRISPRLAVSVVTFALGLTLSAGCAIDKGTALAAEFEEDWAGTPDVATIRTTKNNTLPFKGTSDGTLVVEDGTPADRVTRLAGEMREYVARHDKITGRIMADGVTCTVVADTRRTHEVLALWRSLTADTRVVNADIDDAPWKEATERWRIEVTAADATGALAVFKDMLAGGDRHQPLSGVTVLQVRGPGLFVETDFHDGFPAEAIAAYEAVLARYPVAGASLRRDAVAGSAVDIVVAKSADQDHARELARKAAPNLGAAVDVTSRSAG
ncbi:hypothetical protein OG279_19785 [Streptomyces sp. NBC_01201]|uniref:hypothetical protein n=1 Tax=Streptomyces sp. NBC_01201 TaxID=2903770 RepID=UPI002E14916D|nr:hypothetical protein OG279_19785 [Streptomyces sp. NBC_01201]